MHIGIDARFYGPFGKGLGRYVQKLIEHLEKAPGPHRFTIMLRRENWDAYTPRDDRFTKLLADFPWYSVNEQIGFTRLLLRQRFDLVHFPHYNVPLLYRRPFVVTIHDLIVSRYPTVRATTLNPLFYKLKHAAYLMVIRSAIHRARHILTVSEYSKKVIQEMYHVPGDRITVTYEAAERLQTGVLTSQDTERADSLRPYLLYVGNAYPHKNLENLLLAFQLLRQTDRTLKLVLVGKADYFYTRLADYAKTLDLGDAVVFTGYVNDAELASLYARATLYVFPSYEEGFGLPPLEAMQEGVPVASSNRSCLPEILGDAVAYFDPSQPKAIADAVAALLSNPEQCAEFARRGRARCLRFRWDDLARKTLDVYTGQ